MSVKSVPRKSVGQKRRAAAQVAREADRLHSESTERNAPRAWLWWLAGSIGAGALLTPLNFISPSRLAPNANVATALYGLSIVVTVALLFVFVLGTARTVLTGRPAREALAWVRSEQPMTTLASTALIAVGLLAVAILSGKVGLGTFFAVQAIGAFIAVYRGLSLVYRHQYLGVVLSPGQKIAYEDKLATRSRLRRTIEWVFGTRALTTRHRMILPAVQTLLVLYPLIQVWTFVLVKLGVDPAKHV